MAGRAAVSRSPTGKNLSHTLAENLRHCKPYLKRTLNGIYLFAREDFI
jgi:hypothetical protein